MRPIDVHYLIMSNFEILAATNFISCAKVPLVCYKYQLSYKKRYLQPTNAYKGQISTSIEDTWLVKNHDLSKWTRLMTLDDYIMVHQYIYCTTIVSTWKNNHIVKMQKSTFKSSSLFFFHGQTFSLMQICKEKRR